MNPSHRPPAKSRTRTGLYLERWSAEPDRVAEPGYNSSRREGELLDC